MNLASQQQQLAAAIRDGAEPAGLLAGNFATGLAVYRHAYRARLVEALADNHTVLARALGDTAFELLAHAYLEARPSQQPSLRGFGQGLADFMAADNHARVPHPSFVDVARMDWALRCAFDAADAPLLDAATLAAIAQVRPQDWAGLVLRLHPSVQRVVLHHAIEPAWQQLRTWQPESGDDPPELDEPAAWPHTLLAWRQGLDTRWRSLDTLEAALLEAVADGLPVAALCERAAALLGDPEAAAPAVVQQLQGWLTQGLLQALSQALSRGEVPEPGIPPCPQPHTATWGLGYPATPDR